MVYYNEYINVLVKKQIKEIGIKEKIRIKA